MIAMLSDRFVWFVCCVFYLLVLCCCIPILFNCVVRDVFGVVCLVSCFCVYQCYVMPIFVCV